MPSGPKNLGHEGTGQLRAMGRGWCSRRGQGREAGLWEAAGPRGQGQKQAGNKEENGKKEKGFSFKIDF